MLFTELASLDPDGDGRAQSGGLAGVRELGFRWCVMEEDNDAVGITLVEYVGCGQHALLAADALILVDDDIHGRSSHQLMGRARSA